MAILPDCAFPVGTVDDASETAGNVYICDGVRWLIECAVPWVYWNQNLVFRNRHCQFPRLAIRRISDFIETRIVAETRGTCSIASGTLCPFLRHRIMDSDMDVRRPGAKWGWKTRGRNLRGIEINVRAIPGDEVIFIVSLAYGGTQRVSIPSRTVHVEQRVFQRPSGSEYSGPDGYCV